jgi:hypothetical protein
MDEFSAILIVVILVGFISFVLGRSVESNHIKDKCMIELQDKPHKEATTICNERVK